MTRATAQDYLWWEEFRSSLGVSGFCFTLVAGLQPAEVLERLSVKPDEPLQAEGYIEVGHAGGGSVIVEPAGYMGIMREGINGRLEGHHIDLGDPKNRLAHGRVAQTLLAALMVAITNELILLAWRQAHDHREPPPEDTYAAGSIRKTTTGRLIRWVDNRTALPRPTGPVRPAASIARAPSGSTPPAPFTTDAKRARSSPPNDPKT
ncbi:DUF6461 domain-containing protein [Nonomuraea pusilla]|uniref:DUF6461 domain-containing protein n=1 Tax=Nonomuraea pusilla TaxID=46177 RepID=UPI00331D88D8